MDPSRRLKILAFIFTTVIVVIGRSWAQQVEVQVQEEEVAAETNHTIFRVCVPFWLDSACRTLNEHVEVEKGARIECLLANDKISCLGAIAKNEADFMPLEPEELYTASLFGDQIFQIIGEIRDKPFDTRNHRYSAVAVIRNTASITSLSSLKGKQSCHTGYGRNAGWKVPFSFLFPELECGNPNELPTYERDLNAMNKFWGKACAVGPWVQERSLQRKLESSYSSLCSLCSSPVDCNSSDPYSGYEGALKCLTEGGGEVAWTKLDAVQNVFNLKPGSTPIPISSSFSFLCLDNTVQPLTSPNPCAIAQRPWAAMLASSSLKPDEVESLLTSLKLYTAVESPAIANVLEVNATAQTFSPYTPLLARTTTPLSYLDSLNYTATITRSSCDAQTPSPPIRLCVRNELERSRCDDLRLAAIGQRVRPKLACKVASDCLASLKSGDADVTVVTARTAVVNKLTPILSTVTSMGNDTKPANFRYAVALINKDSQMVNISQLRGTNACFGSVDSLVSWRTPLFKLREAGLFKPTVDGKGCGFSTFFNGSCAPGGAGAGATRKSWWPTADRMCGLCEGDSNDTATRSPNTLCAQSRFEMYYGEIGALKCLTDGVADVAFVDHLTVLDLLQGPGLTPPFKLLCAPTGSMPLASFRHCNWGTVPTRQLIVRKTSEEDKATVENVRGVFLRLGSLFGARTRGERVMKLFGKWYGRDGVLFGDASLGFIDYSSSDISTSLTNPSIQDIDPCSNPSSATSTRAFSMMLILLLIPVIFAQA